MNGYWERLKHWKQRRQSKRSSSRGSISRVSSIGTTESPDVRQVCKEDLEKILQVLGDFLDSSSPESRSNLQEGFSDTIFASISLSGAVLDQTGREAYKEAAYLQDADWSKECLDIAHSICSGVGNLHWMGAGLLCISFCISRIAQKKGNDMEAWKVLGRLRDLAQAVIKIIDELDEKTIENVYRTICSFAAECSKLNTANSLSRLAFAKTNEEMLRKLNEQINRQYPELILAKLATATKRTNVPPEFKDHAEKSVIKDHVHGLVKCLEERAQSPDGVPEGDVRAVVVWGMPGIGTSTVAEALCAQLAKKNSGLNVYVNMREREQTELSVEEKQSVVIDALSNTAYTISDISSGQCCLRSIFSKLKKPVLLFFDNVADEDHLRQLLPDQLNTILPLGSRIVVSTFTRSVCGVIEEKGLDGNRCKLHAVGKLKPEQAENLLCRTAFGTQQAPEGLKESVRDVLKLVEGLPLAIDVVGKDVFKNGKDPKSNKPSKDKQVKVLNHAVASLSAGDPIRGSKNDRISASLEVPFRQLGKGTPVENAFLDICATFNGGDWREGEHLYGEHLETLRMLSLVVKKERVNCDGQSYTVEINKLVEAMGPKFDRNSERLERVVLKNGEDYPVHPEVQVLVVDNWGRRGLEAAPDNQDLPHFHMEWLSHTTNSRNLRHLQLTRTRIAGSYTSSPKDSQLQTFVFDCPESELPFPLTRMNKLTFLKIRSNTLVDLALQDFKVPRKLKFFCLSDSNIDKIKLDGAALEQVIIRNCPNLQTVVISSSSVTNVSIIGCGLLELRVPSQVQFLDLSENKKLITLTATGDCSQLERLVLQNCSLLIDIDEEVLRGPCTDKHTDIRGCAELLKPKKMPALLKKGTGVRMTSRERFFSRSISLPCWWSRKQPSRLFRKIKSDLVRVFAHADHHCRL